MDVDFEKKESVLRLHSLFVNEINYTTSESISEHLTLNGNDEDKYSIKCAIGQENEYFIVQLHIRVVSENNKNELSMGVKGIFSIDSENDLSNDKIKDLLTQNAVAIIFPYLRTFTSTIANMTNLGSVSIPIFNIVAALSRHQGKTQDTQQQASDNENE